QPFPDEGPEDDLKAHGKLERGGRPSRQDPSPVQDVLRENEEDALFVLEHPHLHFYLLPSGLRPTRRHPFSLGHNNIFFICYITYMMLLCSRQAGSCRVPVRANEKRKGRGRPSSGRAS